MTNNESRKYTKRQKVLITGILVSMFIGIAITAIRYLGKSAYYVGMEGTALLYIAVPTFIALAFASSRFNVTSSGTVMGATLKTITFLILMSGPILQEGFVCMIMAAPILYIVGALAAWPFDVYRKNRSANNLKLYILPTLLLLTSLEGVFVQTSFNRSNTVEHSQIINSDLAAIKSKLASDRQLAAPDSLMVKIFPRPAMITANGLAIGDLQTVDISYFKWIYWNEKRGKIQFEVANNSENIYTFKLVKDDSYLHTYLAWKDTTVILQPLSEHRTKVTWRISFDRKIDPAWYVQPLERYSVTAAAEMMVASLQ